MAVTIFDQRTCDDEILESRPLRSTDVHYQAPHRNITQFPKLNASIWLRLRFHANPLSYVPRGNFSPLMIRNLIRLLCPPGPLKVLVRRLCVVFHTDLYVVPHALRNDLGRELFEKFRPPTRLQIFETFLDLAKAPHSIISSFIQEVSNAIGCSESLAVA